MDAGRRSFLELLSRMDLTQDQSSLLVSPEERKELWIAASDHDFVANPYMTYEVTRLTTTPVSIGVVDRGMFPSALIRTRFPVPEPSQVKTAVDASRLRALVIRNLEMAAQRGDTLRTRDDVIHDRRKQAGESEEQKARLTADLLGVGRNGFA